MCGIVGYIGDKNVGNVLLEGLKRLEYRGYDSSGIATLENNKVVVEKAVGRIVNLEEKLSDKKDAKLGICHTRWATHGEPSEENAHPHKSCKSNIALVHNGIIENYAEIREELKKSGHKFISDTDTEALVHLIEELYNGNLLSAVQAALKKVRGAYGIAVISASEPERIIAARMGSPLILGVGKNEHFIASDVSAFLGHTNQVVYLNDGEIADVKKDSFELYNLKSKKIPGKVCDVEWSLEEAEKGGYDHFMFKEIMEQPKVIEDSTRGRIDLKNGDAFLGGLSGVYEKLKNIERIIIVACGTARYAGLVGEYMLEEHAGIPVEVEYASEFRYRSPVINKNTAVIAISQSGETVDTLAALREAKKKGALTLGIVNAVGSTIARETDAGVYNHAGPEIAVASTKAFTSQLTVLTLLTVLLGRQRGMSQKQGEELLSELKSLPKKLKGILENKHAYKKLAEKYKGYENFMYLGRKYNFPLAEEGALKLKEISYVNASGYASGEMKHGSIALIDENFPTFAIIPRDSVYEKVVSNVEEIRARGGKVIALTTKGNKKEIENIADDVFEIPETIETLIPLLAVTPLQLFAYYVSVARGLDVDKPRNLAKSVTVE